MQTFFGKLKSKGEGSSSTTAAVTSKDGEPPAPRTDIKLSGPWTSPRILTLDGSGTEGLFSLYVLEALMNEIGSIEEASIPPAYLSKTSPLFKSVVPGTKDSVEGEDVPFSKRYLPCHYFDCISGAGTGGVVAIMLGVLEMNVTQAIEVGERIFEGMQLQDTKRKKDKRENSKKLQARLEELFERNGIECKTLESDVYACQTLVFNTHKPAAGLTRPFVFRSYRQIGRLGWYLRSTTCHVSIVDACRACLASPSCFNSVEISPLNGSFWQADLSEIDPASETHHEIRDPDSRWKDKVECLLSIGTGRSLEQGVLEDRVVEEGLPYARLAQNKPNSSSSADFEKVDEVKDRAMLYIESHQLVLQEWAQRLVYWRRQRAHTTHWARFAGLLFACCVCGQVSKKTDLAVHMQTKHPQTWM